MSRIALVTGGAGGIGLAITKKLLGEGFRVIVADIRAPEFSDGQLIFQKTDLTDAAQVAQLSRRVEAETTGLDVLVLNAGQGIQEKLTEGDPEKWQKILDLNLMAPLRCIRAFVPPMQEREKGDVVFVSSVAANQPHPYGGIYSASKSALETIAETLRLEAGPKLRVTLVNPGVTDTGFFKNQISGFTTVDSLEMGAMAPEEIAEDIWYALSKKGSTAINRIVSRPVHQEF